MKKLIYLLSIAAVMMLSACQGDDPAPGVDEGKVMNPDLHAVTVVEVIQVPDYSYLEVEENGERYWMAVGRGNYEKGEQLFYSQSMEMNNFQSTTLDRTFDRILFVQNISRNMPAAEGGAGPNPHGNVADAGLDAPIEPVAGGKTVADIFANSASLAGQTVRVKGKVVKYNANIMGRNWIHLQDGTGENGSNDLTVTSDQTAAVGDVVVAEGVIAVDQDLGSGYFYKVILEKATIEKQ